MAGGVALIAGASPGAGLRLALAMFCLQAAIGTANDIRDADADRERKPRKPIPHGLVGAPGARRTFVACLAAGLVLSAVSGGIVLVVALLGTSLGLAYDLRLKGTPWSWLPFALGIPLLPVFGWIGARGGTVPGSLLLLVALAVPAGAALALANALGDLERDAEAGIASAATALGRGRAWLTGAVLQGAVLVVALGTLLASGAGTGTFVGALGASMVVLVGLVLGRSASPARRELGWEVQAVGLAILAAAWLLAMGPAGRT